MRPTLLIISVLLLAGCTSQPEQQASPSQVQSTQVPSADVTMESVEGEEALLEDDASETESEQESDDQSDDSAEELESEGSEADESETDEREQSESNQESERNSDDELDEGASGEPEQTQTPTPAPTAEPSPDGYTLAEVSQRATSSDCWVAIDGGVYDLTDWIRSHPGGSGAISNLCGTDGTASFTSKHGGQARPSSTLDGYYLAPLVG